MQNEKVLTCEVCGKTGYRSIVSRRLTMGNRILCSTCLLKAIYSKYFSKSDDGKDDAYAKKGEQTS